MSWSVRPSAHEYSEDCVKDLIDIYDDFFTVKVNSLGSFTLYPTVVYEGGTTIDVDWLKLEKFDLKDIDEFALRSGYVLGSKLFYDYKEPGMGLTFGLRPLLSSYDVMQFRELTNRERCIEIYIKVEPCIELCRLYTRGMPIRVLDCNYSTIDVEGNYECVDSSICLLIRNVQYDIASETANCGLKDDEVDQIRLGDDDVTFFRHEDGFDAELDEEIREETMALRKEMLAEIEKVAKENAMNKKKKGDKKWQKFDRNRVLGLNDLDEGIGSSSQSKKKVPGTYARHGLEFKIRKNEGYVESSTDKEDSILSDSDSDESLKSRADSSDEEAHNIQSRKDIRYVKFNEKEMQDPKIFVGLVFSNKAQMKEAVAWYSVINHKP